MADGPIPDHPPGKPVLITLAAGTRLCRVHEAGLAPTAFGAMLAPADGPGGRFDATEADPYPYLYAADDESTAIDEALLRDHPAAAIEAWMLPRAAVRNRCLSWLETTRPLRLVALRSEPELAAVGQDEWLVTASARASDRTRAWGHAIRRFSPRARGFAWPSRRHPQSCTLYIFFGDRTGDGAFRQVETGVALRPGSNRLDRADGELLLRRILQELRVVLGPETG
jgi:hypothetical protein